MICIGILRLNFSKENKVVLLIFYLLRMLQIGWKIAQIYYEM